MLMFCIISYFDKLAPEVKYLAMVTDQRWLALTGIMCAVCRFVNFSC
jgi:hypothetical protein